MLFDSYFTFESKLGWHMLFVTVESTREIRRLVITIVVVFELLEEMVAWGCRNDLPARFTSATLHVDKYLKMAAKLGDCRKLEVEMLQEAKVIITDPDTAPCHLPTLTKLKWIQLTWAGIDAVTKHFTTEQKQSLLLTRFGGVFGPAMAQYVIGQIISWERNFPKMWTQQQECKWDREWQHTDCYRVMPQLSIGILGLGDIGKAVAKACKALGMKVWGIGRRERSADVPSFVDHYTTASSLPEVLQSCNYICNILPSTPATKHLLSGNVLESCKDNHPVLINVGRGDVIDEKSLVQALNQGWISGAILDVFEVEPLPKESVLWNMQQVVITPHVSALSFPHEVAELFAENLSLYESGKKLQFLVDLEQGY